MRYEGDLQELPRQMIKLFLQHLQLSALIYYFVREHTYRRLQIYISYFVRQHNSME